MAPEMGSNRIPADPHPVKDPHPLPRRQRPCRRTRRRARPQPIHHHERTRIGNEDCLTRASEFGERHAHVREDKGRRGRRAGDGCVAVSYGKWAGGVHG